VTIKFRLILLLTSGKQTGA